jgi:hypothetical protein
MTPLRKRLLLGTLLAIPSLYSLWYFLLSPEIYMTCREVRGFAGNRLALRWGRFWYSSYSDAGEDQEFSGTYATNGNAMTFTPELIKGAWVMDRMNGVPVLWRYDGWELWKKDSRIHPYGVLIRAHGLIPFVDPPRPSIYSLYSPAMFVRERKEYEERFSEQPAQVRSLMRLATTKGTMPGAAELKNRDEYKVELLKARETISPDLIRPLIVLLGHEDTEVRFPAERILLEIYGLGRILKEEPPFMRSNAERDHALTLLVDALVLAKDRNTLIHTLGIFLRASGVGTMDVPIPEVGVRIRIEIGSSGWQDRSSNLERSAVQPEHWKWEKEMTMIVAACQKWMMEQVRR